MAIVIYPCYELLSRTVLMLDVESVGLYGEAFAVAGAVIQDRHIVQEILYSCPIPEVGDADDLTWVRDNVTVDRITNANPSEVRAEFWHKYMDLKAIYGCALTVMADCCYPVETNFFTACICDDLHDRKFEGPYPLFDLANLLAACGENPLKAYPRTEDELPAHNPTRDVRQSSRLFIELLDKMNVQ